MINFKMNLIILNMKKKEKEFNKFKNLKKNGINNGAFIMSNKEKNKKNKMQSFNKLKRLNFLI